MKYDLEVVVPLSNRYANRIKDFKKYGLLNKKDKKILINIILSNEVIEDVEKDWGDVDINIVSYESEDYVTNVFRFFAELDSLKLNSRWIIKLDDDSSTDVDGLISNLDKYYSCNEKFYLCANLNSNNSYDDPERYIKDLGDFESLIFDMDHEIECSVLSNSALKNILENEISMNFLRKRLKHKGGVTDCCLAFASFMTRIYPINCPFLTSAPMIERFSFTTGDVKNHIHMISRISSGENNYAEKKIAERFFKLVDKTIEKQPTELEKSLFNSKYLAEVNDELLLFDFFDNYTARIKYEFDLKNWYEENGKILVFSGGHDIYSFECIKGNLVDKQIKLEKITMI